MHLEQKLQWMAYDLPTLLLCLKAFIPIWKSVVTVNDLLALWD